MGRSSAAIDVRTYLPEGVDQEEFSSFVGALDHVALEASHGPALVSDDGKRIAVPPAVFEALKQVAEALSRGMGVTVAPMNAMLTTQEAADFLGVSRPTLVRVLERGDLPMERPGRHRFVRLQDLVEYQERMRRQRSEALQEMVRVSEEAGLYEATDGPPPPTR